MRLRNGTQVNYLHRDNLGTVRSITDASAALVEERRYRPFGEIAWTSGSVNPDETIGFIGERYDSDAGLQYLNARYYDPRLAIFIQPDWFEVTEPGVGTNRYAYSFNDPVNLSDPGGNIVPILVAAAVFGAVLGSAEPANAPGIDEDGTFQEPIVQPPAKTLSNMTVGATGGAIAGQALLSAGTQLTVRCAASPACRSYVLASEAASISVESAACAGGDAVACAAMALPGPPGAGIGGRQATSRISIRTDASGNSVVSILGTEMSTHAAQQMTNRNIALDAIADAMELRPFEYLQNGDLLRGYYDASTNVFVGVGERITTVIRPRNPNRYLQNLRNRQ